MVYLIYRSIKAILNILTIGTTIAIFVILLGYFFIKPTLPEIELVDQDTLQVPLQVYSADGVLIGEFGEKKRRTIRFDDIPDNVKNAFLAAEDDSFFNHQGFRLLSFSRAIFQAVRYQEIVSGGGTITMQVVRGYLLSRDQNLIRKLKEIYLAFELESNASKEEIFELYVNTIFLGNRAYGIESAAEVYFGKNLEDLTLAESALIASSAQLPSRINPVRNPERAKSRRNWILSRMYELGYIGKGQYILNAQRDVKVISKRNAFEVDAQHFSELARQSIIKRYGLSAYNQGWKVITTLDSTLQDNAQDAIFRNLELYVKRHGWVDPPNHADQLGDDFFNQINQFGVEAIYTNIEKDYDSSISESFISQLSNIFDGYIYPDRYNKAIVIDVKNERLIVVLDDIRLATVQWDKSYSWARRKINNSFGPRPEGFFDLVRKGDLILLNLNAENNYEVFQLPSIESAFISVDPKNGSIKTYIGGINFEESNFDRVKLSYPQTGSSFKPFIYSAAIANGINPSHLINDAPIIFEDDNLEDYWRPENYTKKFYGLTRLREALVQSINIVSIKLLRQVGINTAIDHLQSFGFQKQRLSPDLSLALGSSSFSPAEMVRAYSILSNGGSRVEPYFIEKIIDRNGKIIYDHNSDSQSEDSKPMHYFPWLNDSHQNTFPLIPPISKDVSELDERVAFIIKDILIEAMQRGATGRKSKSLNREDIGGKTGTTNDAISTWFSGFHDDLVTTIWIGTDDFSSLGQDEFGSTIALPIWVNYMEDIIDDLKIYEQEIPLGVSFVRVNRETGLPSNNLDDKSYFELFLEENINP